MVVEVEEGHVADAREHAELLHHEDDAEGHDDPPEQPLEVAEGERVLQQ